MFIGEYHHNIDSKRRVAVPAKFRGRLGQNVVITKGLEDSLVLYPKTEWKEIGEKLAKLPVGKKEHRDFVRSTLSGAAELEIDRLGRILLPDYLVQHADIKKNVVVIGLFNRIELWDKDKWLSYKEGSEKQTGDIAEKLGELGIY